MANIADNEARFDAIFKSLDCCPHMRHLLDKLQTSNLPIHNQIIPRLVSNSNDIKSLLDDTSLSGQAYLQLLSQCPELQLIVNLTSELDRCIADPSRFQATIDLLERVERLNRFHGHDIPLVQDIYNRTERQRKHLITNLCDKLERLGVDSGEEILATVKYLSIFGDFSDRELRLMYLEARDNWFTGLEQKADTIVEFCSVYSTGLPHIYREYKKIFTDHISSSNRNISRAISQDSTKEDGAVINSWLLLKSSILMASLRDNLSTISEPAHQKPVVTFQDTMNLCFELSTNLASMQFDISSWLRPLFTQTMVDEIRRTLDKSTRDFEARFASKISKSVESLLLPIDDRVAPMDELYPGEQVPKSIDDYPVFSRYIQELIVSLRWLRVTQDVMCRVRSCSQVYSALNISLIRVTKGLSVILNTDNNCTHPILSKIATLLVTEIVPFIANYCGLFLPEKIILNTLGMSKSEFKSIAREDPDKLKGLFLDIKQIVEPLRSTLPSLAQAAQAI